MVLGLSLFAQTNTGAEGENIVPNPSFELYSSPPIGWFYKGEHFSSVMKYWSSPTNASPDVFGPKVRVPAHWIEKGFGKQVPKTGSSMAGITVYGCTEGKPHCREYVQIQLSEPLVRGQDYYAEMWVSHLPHSLRINNIGFHFSKERITEPTDGILKLVPQLFEKQIIDGADHEWIKVSGRFRADAAAEYLILGNFYNDAQTQTLKKKEASLPFAYYYIEDILLKKVPPILPVPVLEDDLTRIKLQEGKVVPLKDIYFELDKSELLPRSFVELRKLLKIMNENPNLSIEIWGHTDNTGTELYNLTLSERRAKAVVDFLVMNGINAGRTHCRGYGSIQPIASNANSKGRTMNRRVEFIILQSR